MKLTGQKRSIVKTITYKTISVTTTGLFTWYLTGDMNAVYALMGVEAILKVLIYYTHERIWERGNR